MPNRTPRILYVDDDPGLALLVRRVMERRGYIFEQAPDGESGLERIRQGGVDVVALDHHLPTGTGLDVLGRMSDLPDRPAVVYVTGSADTDVAVAALKAGASDYVIKTANENFFDFLANAIDHAVDLLRMSRAKALAEREMRDARERAEVLLGEVNHRVANSLAMVAALVGLQANAIENEEARRALSETQARIQAIAGVHRHLYTSDDVRSVHAGDYLRSLAAELEHTMQTIGNVSRLAVTVEDVVIPTEKAASLGVVVTELVTNAIKYAYAGGDGGEVRITMRRAESGGLELTVEDDGVGWDGTGAAKGTGLGSRIVKAMAHGLDGSVIYETRPVGTTAKLVFQV